MSKGLDNTHVHVIQVPENNLRALGSLQLLMFETLPEGSYTKGSTWNGELNESIATIHTNSLVVALMFTAVSKGRDDVFVALINVEKEEIKEVVCE